MTTNSKKKILWLTFTVALVLLAGGVVMAYSLYKELEASLQEVRSAYSKEKRGSERLVKKVDELLDTVKEGRERETSLREARREARDEKVEMEAKISKMEAAVVRWQTAYTTEQAKTRKLTETARDLLGVMEQAQVRIKSLDDGYKVARKEKSRLEAKTKTLETALKRWQTSHAAEQAKNRMLNERAEKLTKLAEQAQDRVHTLEQIEIGRKTKLDLERKWQERAKGWGKNISKGFRFVFF